MTPPNKEYLGDGVYASFDGYGVKLTTENGITITNEIYLESEVSLELVKYLKKIATYLE